MINQQQTFPTLKKTQKRILSGMFVVLYGLFLAGCPMDFPEFAWNNINIVNTSTRTLYYVSNSRFADHSLYLLKFNEIKVVPLCIGNCSNGFDERIDFYQDAQKTCYLFSLNSSILRGSYNDVVILQGNTYQRLSRAEYEKLKPTFKPHPYDASLCKPAPKTERK